MRDIYGAIYVLFTPQLFVAMLFSSLLRFTTKYSEVVLALEALNPEVAETIMYSVPHLNCKAPDGFTERTVLILASVKAIMAFVASLTGVSFSHLDCINVC